MKWIKITDQLPPDYEPVLYIDKREPDRNKIQIGFFVPSQSEIDSYVTHWMPRPKLPKKEPYAFKQRNLTSEETARMLEMRISQKDNDGD